MSVNDPIGDMIARIKNAAMRKRSKVATPASKMRGRVLDALGPTPTSVVELERAVDLRRGRLETLLKILDVDGAVWRADRGWVRSDQPWSYDAPRVARVEAAREAEAGAMVRYARGEECLMAFLRRSLDDPAAEG